MPVIIPSARVHIHTSRNKSYRFSKIRSCKITSARGLPCDTAEITLPRLDSLNLFQENDEVFIDLGNNYLGEATVFLGFITQLSPKNEPVVFCEDYFKTIKETRHTQKFLDTPDAIAKAVIEHCGLEAFIPEAWEHKRHFYWKMQTAAEALEELASIGWDYFCVPVSKSIYFGKPYNLWNNFPRDERTFVYRFGVNVIDSQLEYRTASFINQAIVYVTDNKFRGSSIKVTEGTGEPVKIFNMQMDFDPHNQSSVNNAVDEARKYAKQQIAQSQVSGYRGTFKTFGNPHLAHSMKIKIEDTEKQERSGHYYIDQVIHEFAPDTGYKMEISVGATSSGGSGE